MRNQKLQLQLHYYIYISDRSIIIIQKYIYKENTIHLIAVYIYIPLCYPNMLLFCYYDIWYTVTLIFVVV